MAAALGGPSLGDSCLPHEPLAGVFHCRAPAVQLSAGVSRCPRCPLHVTQPGRAFHLLHTSASRVLDPVLLKPPCSLA